MKATTLDDLQEGPTILIGGLDNDWTLRALTHLRYQFRGTDQEQYWITDTKKPGSRTWDVDLKTQYPAVKRDFALIARVHNDSTRQVQVIVAGALASRRASGSLRMLPSLILAQLLYRPARWAIALRSIGRLIDGIPVDWTSSHRKAAAAYAAATRAFARR